MKKDYYIILGVNRGANFGQIKHAYRRIAKELHPDRSSPPADPDKFMEVKEAYDTLADAEKRRRYDDELHRRDASRRIAQVPEIVQDRQRLYREMEQRRSLVDEFLEGWVPGVYSRRRGLLSEKDIYLEVILSLRESQQGGLFPIRFPVLDPCPHCSRANELDKFFCLICGGHGIVKTEREFSLSIPPRTAHGTSVSLSLEDIGLRGVQLHVDVQVDPSIED